MAITDRPTDTRPEAETPEEATARHDAAEPRQSARRSTNGDAAAGAPRQRGSKPSERATDGPPNGTERVAEPSTGGKADDRELAGAFREVHERRLHAFALLLTLGDRPRAARLADDALEAVRPHVSELTHPERGAAWLRRHVFRAANRGGPLGALFARRQANPTPVREVGASLSLVKSLAALGLRDRAALILNDVEGIRELDIADILGVQRAEVDKIVRKARTRYGRAFLAASREDGTLDNAELPEVIRQAARPALRSSPPEK